MTVKLVGTTTNKVYFEGTKPECMRFINTHEQPSMTKTGKISKSYTKFGFSEPLRFK